MQTKHSADGAVSAPLALTCGDPAGVGPEVIAAALRKDVEGGKDCVLLGPTSWAAPLAAELGISFRETGPSDFQAVVGRPSREGAQVALKALKLAAQGCREGFFRGVISGPVSKQWLQQIGFAHPGQTEFFAAEWGGVPTMGFVGNKLHAVLATWHIPLRDVAKALTAECLESAVRRAFSLARSLGAKVPRIAVCGLNPHAGEGGMLGDEEREVMDPVLDKLRGEISGLSRCIPGDTAFFRQLQGEFDVVVAAYHDQGLAAVKTLEFDSAVNVTLGLPFVRTSPDHGTAFDIAGKGLANCGSFAAALKVARQLTANL